jgi:hypothetical protein
MQLHLCESEIIGKSQRRSNIESNVQRWFTNKPVSFTSTAYAIMHTQNFTDRVAWHTFGALYHCDVATIDRRPIKWNELQLPPACMVNVGDRAFAALGRKTVCWPILYCTRTLSICISGTDTKIQYNAQRR